MSYSVLVVDMYKRPHVESEHAVTGFATLELAREYARRRTWQSVEEQRQHTTDLVETKRRWFEYGFNCSVVDDPMLYHGLQDLDHFLEHPAKGDDANWNKIHPRTSPLAK